MKFIADVIRECNSRDEFEKRIRAVHLQLDIASDGTVRGVIDNRGKRTSWKRCGVSEKDLIRFLHREEMTNLDRRLRRLEKLQQINQQSKERENGIER